MQRSQVEEFYRELEATDEKYVRQRHLTGGYGGWKAKHVKQFLEAKDSARAERRADRATMWTMVGASGGVAAAVAAAVALWR